MDKNLKKYEEHINKGITFNVISDKKRKKNINKEIVSLSEIITNKEMNKINLNRNLNKGLMNRTKKWLFGK